MLVSDVPMYLQTRTADQLREMARNNREMASDLVEAHLMGQAVIEYWQWLQHAANELTWMAARKDKE